MAKILFWPDIYKERGHWLPITTLAKALGENHEVAFMGIKDCESIATSYGFNFYPIFEDIYPTGYSLENDLEPKTQRWKPHHLLPLTRGEGGIKQIFDPSVTGAFVPNILVSGYFTSLETLLLHYKYNLRFVITTTYLRHPDEDPYIRARSQLIHMSRPMSTKLMDTAHPVDTTIGEENVIKDFVLPLKTQPEIIPCPREFDFEHYAHSENVTYVEPMISTPPDTPEEGTEPPEIPPGKKVIFATSGSMVEDYLNKAKGFFKTLMDMMYTSGMTDWHLVLAVGPKLYDDFKDVSKTNVSIYNWVSQIEVLDSASVVFVHGGLATIKESIYKNVPLIIVPHGKDQMDNALRVRKGNLGLIADINKITPDTLKAMMTDAISNTWILQNLEKMSGVFVDAEGAPQRPSVSIIESALNEVPIPPVV